MYLTAVAALAACFVATTARASVPYSQGFESNTNDWFFATDASGTATITQTPSGGGTLHLAPQSGSSYSELKNGDNGYRDPSNNPQPGYGDAGYSNFGGHAPGTYPGSSFYQSMGVYLDTNWAPAASPASAAFWIDMSAASQSTGAYDYGTEHNFRIMSPSGGSIAIYNDGGATPIATVGSSGWYTFQMIYSKGALPTDPSKTTLNVYNSSNALLGSTTVSNTSLSADLGGSGYGWTTLWQNGFAGDHLGIDNVTSGLVPEPASLSLMALGALPMLRRRRAK
jgi:hypothetical protein